MFADVTMGIEVCHRYRIFSDAEYSHWRKGFCEPALGWFSSSTQVRSVTGGRHDDRLVRSGALIGCNFRFQVRSLELEVCMGMGKTGIPWVPWDSHENGSKISHRMGMGWEWELSAWEWELRRGNWIKKTLHTVTSKHLQQCFC